MALFSRLDALRRSRLFKLMVGGSAVGVGAAAGIAAGSTGTEAPDEVRLGGDSGTTVDLEGRGVDVRGDDSLADFLDSPSDGPTASPTDGPTDSPTASPTDSPTDSPGSPDSPDDSPDNSGPSENSGPGSDGGHGDNSGPSENSGPG